MDKPFETFRWHSQMFETKYRSMKAPEIGSCEVAQEGLRGSEALLIRDHVTRSVRPDDAEIYKLMEPGDTYLDVPEHLRRYRSDIFSDKYLRLSFDDLSRTITAHIAKDGYWYIHPREDRTLSIREAARIQTFPDRFRFAGHPSSRYQQIGNAVPPLLASVIASSVRNAIADGAAGTNGSHPKSTDNFRDHLAEWFGHNKRPFPMEASGIEPLAGSPGGNESTPHESRTGGPDCGRTSQPG